MEDCMMKKIGITLKVAEAPQKDVGYGTARVDRKTMEKLELSTGDIIAIKGRKCTGAVIMPTDAADEEKRIIRIDNLTRKNAWVKLGDCVKIRRVVAPAAKKIVMVPVHDEDRVRFETKNVEEIVRKSLLNRPVMAWDSLTVPTTKNQLGGLVLSFVVRTIPKETIVTIADNTRLVFDGHPLAKQDYLVLGLKHGQVIPQLCEPLKDMRFNLQYCPHRDDCKWLNNFFETPYDVIEQFDAMEDVIRTLHCDFCKSDEWVFVGVTFSGSMLSIPMTPKWGRRIQKLIT